MCLSPIALYNPSKVVSVAHGDQYRLQVPCGKCAECQEKKSAEWHMRTHYEFLRAIRNRQYVLFDTLTYADNHLPHLSSIFGDIPVDYPCFSRSDLRYFFVRLRRYWSYRGYKQPFKYFVTAEYGTSPNGTHRPHYHCLFFVNQPISPLEFSRSIAQCWKYGRTDGVPYQSKHYVLENRVYRDLDLHGQKVANYVAKYVQKDCEFQAVINARINDILSRKYSDPKCSQAYSYKLRLQHEVEQFHLQSHDYGIEALNDLDMNDLYNTGMISMSVPTLQVVKHIPLPLYYRRKLFYDCCIIDGKRTWILNDDGKKYALQSLERSVKYTSLRLRNWYYSLNNRVHNVDLDLWKGVDFQSLAEYIIKKRYRFNSVIDCATVVDKLQSNELLYYNYSTRKDYEHFNDRFITDTYQGNDIIGYNSFDIQGNKQCRYKFFVTHCYIDNYYELLIHSYEDSLREINDGKQAAFAEKQRINKRVKSLYSS